MKRGMRARRLMPAALGLIVAISINGSAAAQEKPMERPNILNWPMPETVSPEGREMAKALFAMPQPNPVPPIEAQRAMIDAMQQAMAADLRKRYDVRIEETAIADVPVRIVYPAGYKELGTGPVLLNLHGGGFQVDSGSLTESIPIASISGLPVVAVLYRLAPEHPYPAAVEDALSVYEALARDRPSSRIAVFGTSAGAGLGAQLVSQLIAERKLLPAALGFFSGSADLTTSGDSESWMPLPGEAATLRDSLKGYIGMADPANPVLSPVKGDVARFPPTMLVSSTRDFLLSPTAIFERSLRRAGVETDMVIFDGLPHAFWAYMSVPETDEANKAMAKYLASKVRKIGD